MSTATSYHTPTLAVNPSAWPTAITTEDVQAILAADPTATVEVGPSIGHPRNWNALHIGDAVTYVTRGASNWWNLECDCVLPEQTCPACRMAARRASRRTIRNA